MSLIRCVNLHSRPPAQAARGSLPIAHPPSLSPVVVAHSQQHEQRAAHPHRRTALVALALVLGATPTAAAVAAGSNAAVLEDLKRLNKQKRLFGEEEPGQALSNRLEAVQAQLQRCELLVRIGQYDNARMQLREGAFKTLRLDLGYGQEMYRLVSQQMARDVVEGVERLDGALKRREPPEVVQPMIQRLQQGVKDVSVAMERIGDVR